MDYHDKHRGTKSQILELVKTLPNGYKSALTRELMSELNPALQSMAILETVEKMGQEDKQRLLKFIS